MPTIIKKGEKGNKSKKVDGDLVTVEHVTLNKKAGQHFQCKTLIDFTDVPHDRILELASETVLIQQRHEFKNDENPESEEWDDWTITVADISRRRGKSTKEKAAELLAALSEEDRRALLESMEE